jgi:hypothetical protein
MSLDTRDGDGGVVPPTGPMRPSQAASAGTRARGEMWMRVREMLQDARAFAARRTAYENAGTRPCAVGRMHLEALADVLAGKMPLLADVDRAADIETAIDLADEFTKMIVTQRAYSANAKIITTADEMLDELIRISK